MRYPPPGLIEDRPPGADQGDLSASGTVLEPRRSEAELLYADGNWRPATVLGWYRLDVAHRQPVTNRWLEEHD